MQRKLRILRLDGSENIFVILNAKVRVMAALQHDLGRTKLNGFGASVQNLFGVSHPSLTVARGAIKSAELACGGAHVRVIDIAINQVGSQVGLVAKSLAANLICRPAQCVQGGKAIQLQGLLRGYPSTSYGAVQK